MMSSIFYGEIKEDRFIAKELFTDQVQVDWGSFAYKCTKKQLQKLTEEKQCVISKIKQLDPEKIYGIVFIEES